MRIVQAGNSSAALAAWDSLVSHDPSGHLLQTAGWAELKSLLGWQAERWFVESDGLPLCGAQVLFQRRGPLQFAYLPKGPFIAQQDPGALTLLWETIDRRCRQRLAISLKVEPEREEDDLTAKAWFSENGFIPSPITIQPRRTIIIDLRPSEDEILAGMKSKWRYNTRLAEKRGVVVHEAGAAAVPAFYQLMRATGERDHFGIHSMEYYQRALAVFERHGRAQLLMAEYEGVPLAGLMVFAFNRQAWYLYGASGGLHRELMPNHLLQWRAMQWSKRQGCLQYDLWGIADNESGQDQLAGVGQFKSGFGGRVVRYIGAYDRVYHRLAYRAWQRYYQARRSSAG